MNMAVYEINLKRDQQGGKIYYDDVSQTSLQVNNVGDVLVSLNRRDGIIPTMYQKMIDGESERGSAVPAPDQVSMLILGLVEAHKVAESAQGTLDLALGSKKQTEVSLTSILGLSDAYFHYQPGS